uniref:Zinc finger and BTB domain containing 22b n=1 Tax=Takifugu rubripes TaxID=31033 RepID=H2SAD1_TAKRU
LQPRSESFSCMGSSSTAPRDTPGSVVQVCFPSAQASVLDGLNRQREEGRLCDLSIHVQGHVFKAHRCVLAASSPYFHDQVLLKNMSTVSIPAVMDPLAFESVLSCAYTGRLRMLRDDIVNYLTVGSVLQMWHIVDKCTELLKEGRMAAGGGGGGGGALQESSRSQNGGSNGQQHGSQAPVRPSLSESQSPSSTNYFSPRDGNSFGGSGAATAGASVDGGVASQTSSYCAPSGGEEEEEEDVEEEEEVLYRQRKRRRGVGSGRRKKTSSAPDQEVGVSDSFGVSSYQDGDGLPQPKRPTYSQPSIMPRKQWVVVKTERVEDDDLIVVSGEEGGEEEEEDDEDERELELARERERTDFSISNVRSLSGELGGRSVCLQVDYCQSSEDYLRFEGGLIDQTLAQHLHNTTAAQSQSANRTITTLLGQVQCAAAARAQLFPLDMQGNQVVLYSQASGLSLDAANPSLDGGASGKVFMCHCGKTFTHKSMRDRHINMHLDLRPFHCPVCAKKFKMKHHLTEHMKTHTGLKPYDCLSCGKKFMWRDSFMRHRSHCERRGGAGGEEGSDFLSSHHLLLAAGEGGRGSGRGGASTSSPHLSVLSPQHAATGSGSNHGSAAVLSNNMAAAGGVPHSPSQMFGGLGATRGVCEEDECEVGVNESSVT